MLSRLTTNRRLDVYGEIGYMGWYKAWFKNAGAVLFCTCASIWLGWAVPVSTAEWLHVADIPFLRITTANQQRPTLNLSCKDQKLTQNAKRHRGLHNKFQVLTATDHPLHNFLPRQLLLLEPSCRLGLGRFRITPIPLVYQL